MEPVTRGLFKKQEQFYRIFKSVKRCLAHDRVPEIKIIRKQFIKAEELYHAIIFNGNDLSLEQTLFNYDLEYSYDALHRWLVICERHNQADVEIDRLIWLRCRQRDFISKASSTLITFSLMMNINVGDDDLKALMAEIEVYDNNSPKIEAEIDSWYNQRNAARAELRTLFRL